jgi:hypothetical protein
MTALLVVAAVTVLYARLWRGEACVRAAAVRVLGRALGALWSTAPFLWQVLISLKPRRPG